MAWLGLTITILAIYQLILSPLVSLLRNYQAARRTGLPILISPVARTAILWQLLQKPLTPLLQMLPGSVGSFSSYATMNYWFNDKYRMHEHYGKVFMFVSPGGNELHVADPAVNSQIFYKKREFDKSPHLLSQLFLAPSCFHEHPLAIEKRPLRQRGQMLIMSPFLEATMVYGDSVTTVVGADWARHRKITVTPFNERNNRLVWDEGVRQATQLAAHWTGCGSSGSTATLENFKSVTVNILATSAMSESWDFRGQLQENASQEGKDDCDQGVLSYRDCLVVLVARFILLCVLPVWFYDLPSSYIPKSLRKFVLAYHSFKKHMVDKVSVRKAQFAEGELGTETATGLLSALVLRSEEVRKEIQTSKQNGPRDTGGLADDEIFGNLFTFNVAGYDTTSGVLTYATYLMAAYPEYQDWVYSEVQSVFDCQDAAGLTTNYEDVFPRMRRCLAIMLETLRLYGPIHCIMKAALSPQGDDLLVDGRKIIIPPETLVIPNVLASQTLPEFWGRDSLEWNPKRWMGTGNAADLSKAREMGEEARAPSAKDFTYFPWSGGARVCPGKKFSQVEFVAVISTLLRRFKIEVVPLDGETEEEARARCLDTVKDSDVPFILTMKRPESVSLRLVAR